MTSGEREPRGWTQIVGVLSPTAAQQGARVTARVSVSLTSGLYKMARWKFFNLRAAQEVLRRPSSIYRGIRPEAEEWGWCYVGRPSRLRSADDGEYSMPEDRCFLVFMNDDLSVEEWGLEKPDSDSPAADTPRRALQRFGRLVWESHDHAG